MKNAYILIALILIIVGVVSFLTREPQTITNGMPVPDEQGAGVEEQVVTNEESVTGTDVGMEIPVSDISGVVEMEVNPDAKVFEISGKNFVFDVEEMRVKKGDTVVVKFTSTDGLHDFVIDEFNARTERVKTGVTTQLTFVADATGTFEYYCSVGQHRMNGMIGTLIVE